MSIHTYQATADPPLHFSAEAEASVLGGILADPNALPRVRTRLEPGAFYLDRNRRVYAAMLRLMDRGGPPDLTLLVAELRAADDLDAAGGIPYLSELQDTVPTSANIDHHINAVAEKARERKVIGIAEQIRTGTASLSDLTADLQKAAAPARHHARPLPLERRTREPSPFPVDALGDVLGPAAEAIHDRTQAPKSLCAQSALAGASLAVQGHVDVVLPTGARRPASVFLLCLAESGERKSAADDLALDPVSRREEELAEQYRMEVERYRNAEAAHEKARAEVLAQKDLNRTARQAALDALGPAPTAPAPPLLTTPDPTWEGLLWLQAQQPSVAIATAEGGLFAGSNGMNSENRDKMAAGLNSEWDGTGIKRSRRGDGSTVLHGRRLTVNVLIQPEIGRALLGDSRLDDQGFLARFLVVAPPPAAGTRFWREPRPESDAALRRYSAHLLEILRREPPYRDPEAGGVSGLNPRPLRLSPDARRLWIEFSNEIEAQVGPGGGLARVKPFACKLAEHAARLAAILAAVENIDCSTVENRHMEAALRLAVFYADEAQRIKEESAADPDLRDARTLLSWLHAERMQRVAVPVVQRFGPNALRSRKAAGIRSLLGLLSEYGWLWPIPGGCTIDAHHYSEAFEVVPPSVEVAA